MKAKAAITIFVLGCASLAGCACNAAVPPTKGKIENTLVLNMPYEDAWKKSVQVLAAEGYPIKVSNRQDGIITTEKKLVRLTETQADCGNIWGIPYTKDTRTTTNAALSIVLRDDGGKTAVTVNSQIEGVFNAAATTGTKQLSCYSLGYLEKDLIDKIAR